jgi:very-short-patch-repair endonuclease
MADNFIETADVEQEAPPAQTASEETSIFQSTLPIETKLERARMELLDLSARNRLLNMPRSGKSAKILEIVDERSAEVLRLLVKEGRALTFMAGKAAPASDSEAALEDSDEIAELAQPDDDGIDARGVANRHADTRLQTRMTPAGLQKRLLDLYHDARTLEEEQGVNILFLALGSLRWVDPNNDKLIRHAPLVLVPVSLERGNAAEKFKLRWRLEDIASNLSLEAFLDRVHGIKLPTFEAGDDFDISKYVGAVGDAVSAKRNWGVTEDDIVLGFFSFAKFLMYRDLDPANWPKNAKLSEHGIIRPLVADGFEDGAPLLPEDTHLDQHIPPSDLLHIVDSDSSQSLAIHEVRKGRNLVIQGPPGTGKSQTIANVIAAAVADGKTVLFVAEKMAALEVVKRRLDNAGVGDMCLELHSNKANKRAVLDELRRTWELGVPKGNDANALNSRLAETRETLNSHAKRLHKPLGAANFTPYHVIGHLTRLRQSGQGPNDLALEKPESWTQVQLDERSRLVDELAERVTDIGVPAHHVWRGVGLRSALPQDVERLVGRMVSLIEQLQSLDTDLEGIAELLETEKPKTLADADRLQALAQRIVDAPEMDPDALGSQAWDASSAEILTILSAGQQHAKLRAELSEHFTDEAWAIDIAEAREVLAALPEALSLKWFVNAHAIVAATPSLIREAAELASVLGRSEAPRAFAQVRELAAIGERVATSPDADPSALAADLWNSSVERAADLASAVATLECSREEVGTQLTEAAWSADLSAARQTLAGHGTSFFRVFSGEWRRANRVVRSYLSSTKVPLDDQLALLDALGRGQAALGVIEREKDFGATAFGVDWRNNRSSSAPLLAMVEWMRSLSGLGAEPRIIASKRPDKLRIGKLSHGLTSALGSMDGELDNIWRELDGSRANVFGAAEAADQAELANVAERLSPVDQAHGLYEKLAKAVEPQFATRRAHLASLAQEHELAGRISNAETIGQSAFGSSWTGISSPWEQLGANATWITANLDIHGVASRIVDARAVATRADATIAVRECFASDVEQLLSDLKAGSKAAVAPGSAKDTEIAEVEQRLQAWVEDAERLSKWAAYSVRADLACEAGMADLVARLHSGSLTPDVARPFFEMSYFEAVFRDQVKAEPELAQFDGELHDRTVRTFADLDLQRIKLSALEVARAHHRRIPASNGGALGPLGVLKSEIARKRGHMPIRQLMQKAGAAVQSLKPVMMMSPLSVAQFLQPGGMTFDLLVMDEASQIQPVDALGAIARSRQVVVVGDPQQLPPTAFFSKLVGGTDGSDDDEGAARVGDIESILGLFTARGLPMRMLRWHYRSRHQSLIAVSNRQFYENKLFIVPSPFLEGAGVGLRFHHIKEGVFESGTTRTNPIEAKVVAKAIIAHAVANPDLSLGVAAFSAAQRRAIMDQLELLRRTLPPQHEAFFQSHPAEPFFIKNLENVQGDERDVIFISVGYGPTAPGLKPPMRFGPLGQEGGERRLNVLISRAKRRCEVFASMTDEDIEPDFASTRKGVYAFKLFMHFARTGRMAMAETASRDHDSVFEEQVADALQAQGYQIHRQVGIAGFFIDLAVADPNQADRYLLGIECDGAAYHEARSARDRDRLRQAVLEDHGWIIHRIWSADWFQRPREQLSRVAAAIEAAKVELEARRERGAAKRASLEIVTVDRGDVTEIGLNTVESGGQNSVPYVEATPKKPDHIFTELHDAPTGLLTAMAEEVVGVEGPVHLDEVVARIRDSWGLRRAGGRIQDAISRAVRVSTRQQSLMENGGFLWRPGTDPVVRDRSSAASPSLRKPELLPPTEIRAALISLVADNFGATEDQCVLAASRAFGFKSTSAQLRQAILKGLKSALNDQVLVRHDGLIGLGPNAPVRKKHCPEPSPVEELITRGEGECIEFKQTLRWDVRQNIVNAKLEDVLIKTLAAFANRVGGTLLIGVGDDGTIHGIAADLATFADSVDKLELHLTNLLANHFGQAFKAAKIAVSFPRMGDKLICRVDVQRSRVPVWVKLPDRTGSINERLFVRSGNSSQELPPSQATAYEREHFGGA